jgi:hypothetical protein
MRCFRYNKHAAYNNFLHALYVSEKAVAAVVAVVVTVIIIMAVVVYTQNCNLYLAQHVCYVIN